MLNLRTNFYADFYRTKIDIELLSCDWKDFIFPRIFTVSPKSHDLTDMEFLVNSLAEVLGKIRPLEYLPVQAPCVVFEVGGRYRFLNGTMDYVESFSGDFASDEEFLLAATERPESISGTKNFFPDDLEDLYAAMGKEQRRKERHKFQIRHVSEEVTHPSIFDAIRHTVFLVGRLTEHPTHLTPNRPDTPCGTGGVFKTTSGTTEGSATVRKITLTLDTKN
ncbi:hypothetical protein C8R45DRAFT_926964 [Mycena sanguinolenta]|nr:hypothetical protein C8R45DRAFT_926964 [Mycena sanguinolenta]